MNRTLSVVVWVAVALAGAGAFAGIALQRGETISAAWLLTAAICTYAVAYRFYSKIIAAKVFALDATRATPAERLSDGRDFVPTNKWIVFGHHFAAISGPGPLVGPTLAAQFGYLPGALWIIVGVALGGAVQDMVILASSVRRDGKSLGQMAREEIGPVAGTIASVAVLGIMIVLISVLALVVVNALRASPWGTVTIGLTIPIAMLMGSYLRWVRPGRVLEATAIGLVLLIGSLYAGRWVAEHPTLAPMFTLSGTTLAWAVMVYGFAASVMPVWLLLAPRDYLSAFVKIGVVIALAVGILMTLPPLQMPAVTTFIDGTGPVFAGKLFPFLFVTIACGAISGFHALVASGTTPKLVANETDIRMIGYGAMLTESLVAVMALIAACVLTPGIYFAINAPAGIIGTTAASAAEVIRNWGFMVTPEEIDALAVAVGETSLLSRTGGAPSLAVGMANIFSQVLGGSAAMALWYHFAIMFEALFILTTLDAGTRVGRFMLQDLGRHIWEPFGRVSWYPAVVLSSSIFVAMWGYFLYQGVTDPLGGINSLWPLFGISNQLLAAVALCVGTTIFVKMGKAKYAPLTLLPLTWLTIVTWSAGWAKIFSPDPRIGFLAHARVFSDHLAAGTLPAGVKSAADVSRMIFNDRLDAAVAGFFLFSAVIILFASIRVWVRVLRGVEPMKSTEVPYTAIAAAAVLFAVAVPRSTGAQQFDMSMTNIMRGPELTGRAPSQIRWTADSKWIYFSWAPPGTAWDAPTTPYRVQPGSRTAPEPVSAAHLDSVTPSLTRGIRSPNGQQELINAGGDLYVMDVRTLVMRRLTETLAFESGARWDRTGARIIFSRDGQAFALELAGGAVRQLTDVRPGPAPRDAAAPTGQRGALVQDQLDLLQVIRDQARRDSAARVARLEREGRALRPAYLGTGERLVSVEVSPSLTHAVVIAERTAASVRRADVPNYVTADGFSAMIPARTKVGDEQNARRAGVLTLATGDIVWLKPTLADTVRAPSQLNTLGWNDDGTTAALFSVTYDFKVRYLHAVDAASGRLTLVDELRDTAWVAGPCFGCGGWTDTETMYYVSEATGYAHLYTVKRDGSAKTAVTSGRWELNSVELSPDRKTFYISSHEESPYVEHYYRQRVGTTTREKLTSTHGGHSVTLAPDGVQYADVFSESNRPPELFSGRLGSTATVKHTTSPTAEWLAGPWIKPEIIQIRASDGIDVPARIYEPKSFGVQPNGAAVIFVHGAGYLHNVHDYWSSYSREYMFHHLLAQQGYVVLDVDYRASAGYGRDWRTAIYRWMGGRDLADHVDASKWLTANRGVAPERIGIYGGSYGGFMTLMALFNAPDYFGAGAALRPVTDWAHYNHGYTGRILNFPQTDTTAYRKSSPIFFAEGLKDPLLIAHGMVDVNVHYQDVVRLTQKLIELGKTNWELASYPVEDHGFTRPSSWADEYRRIYELFERSLHPGGRR
jgi:carbon starvation protein